MGVRSSLRPANCFYLHNFPTPPSCDSPSYDRGFFNLSNVAGDARGMTKHGTSIWVVDKDRRKVIKYSLSGAILGDFQLALANRDPRGITTDGASFWVVDDDDRKVYTYDLFGTLIGQFDLTSPNRDSRGITTDGASIWVVDDDDRKVYKYDMSGNLVGEFPLVSSNHDPDGITTDGAFLWVVDEEGGDGDDDSGDDDDRKVYKYDLLGNSVGDFDLDPDNRDSQGITTDGTSIWVVDKDDRLIYAYGMSGGSAGSFEMKMANRDPKGITRDESFFWVVDDNGRKVFKYDASGCNVGAFDLADANRDPRGVATDGTFIWVVDRDDRKVYRHDISGSSTGAGDFALATANRDPRGITTDGAFIWVVDRDDRQVYKYDVIGNHVSAGDFSLSPGNSDPRGIATNGSSIWLVDRSDRKAYEYDIAGNIIGSIDLVSGNNRATGITTFGNNIWVVDEEGGDGDDDSGDNDDDPKHEVVFEYGTDGSVIDALPMDETAPTAETLFNYDTDRDQDRGLLVRQTSKGLEETNTEKYQNWRTSPLEEGLVITGDVYVTFFATNHDHDDDDHDGKEGKVDVFLRDYDGAGGYTEISRGTSVDPDWHKGPSHFIEKTIAMAAVDYTIPPGHQLELRFIVRTPGSHHMEFAYDTLQYGAILKITQEFRIGGTPFYLHNEPTPPNSDTQSPGIAGRLVSSNNDATGLAAVSDGGPNDGFLVVDEQDDRVYQYDLSGNLTGSFDLVSGNRDAEGITTDGSTIWVVDEEDQRVYLYSFSGTSLGSFDLISENADAMGIAKGGSSLWVLDSSKRRVYEYDLSGNHTGGFDLVQENGNARGIVTDGFSFWVVDRSEDRVYEYDSAGFNLSTFDLINQNSRPAGIETDGETIWVVDDPDRKIYAYDMDGFFKIWLPMDQGVPTAQTLFNYDVDENSKPGLRIRTSSKGITETNTDKFQTWRSVPLSEDLLIEEDSSIDFWAAIKDFKTGKSGEITVFLRDLDPAGNYTEIGDGTVFDPDWHGVITDDFVKKNITIPDPDYTVPAGHRLEVKVVVDEKSQDHMEFAYDTAQYPAVLIPSVIKSLGNGVGTSLEFLNGASPDLSFPVNFDEADFRDLVTVCADPASLVEILCDFQGDVNLNGVNGVWQDAAHTRLKPGVYYTAGDLSLGVEGLRGEGVSFVARHIRLEGSDSRLTPHSSGQSVLFFATGSDDKGEGVKITGNSHMLSGIIYSPQGLVNITASGVILDGSIFSNGFEGPGSANRIAFDPGLF